MYKRQLGKRPYLEVFGTDYPTADGTCIRDYVHVSDLARAHVAALRYLRAKGKSEVLNCGYGTGFSVLEVIAAINRIAQKPIPTRLGPRRMGDAPSLIAQTSKIGRLLDWHPQQNDLSSIVKHALAWEQCIGYRQESH